MKKRNCIILTLALAAATLSAQTTPVPQQPNQPAACASVNNFAGQSAWQATYADAKNGATFSNAVWVVTGTSINAKNAIVRISVYASVAAAQDSCLQPVDVFGVNFTGAAFASNFGSAITPVAGQTFTQAVNATALAAIKATSPVSAQLATATSVTL